jgi:serine/threonine protein kinase
MDAMDPFDLVGDVLDGFRVEEFIGEGALSVVYRARNVGLAAPACVKCLNLPATLDPSFAQSIVMSFQEGCKLHYRLARGHLVIAQTFASGTTVAPRTGSQVHYIVREWFEGESLTRDLRRRRAEGNHGRSLVETVALFEPIVSALTYAETQDASHLSLMPSNMFLATSEEGATLKLLDFGVGRAVDEAASSRTGKPEPAPRMKLLLPAYAAPEQLLGTLGPVGSWTDVYAFALVLLEVLSDRPVMAEKDATALVARTLSTTSRPTPQAHGVTLPAIVDRALVRALALEPELRQTTVAELWAEITSAVRPARNERRRLVAFLRRMRRSRRTTVMLRRSGNSAFPEEEAPTAKARGVVGMLTARTMRASTRPPPLRSVAPPPTPSKKPPPPRPALSKAPPPRPPAIAPTSVGVSSMPESITPAPVEATPPVESSGRLDAHEVAVREPQPVLPSPFALPQRSSPWDRRMLILAGVGSAIALSVVVLLVALVRHVHRPADAHVAATLTASAPPRATVSPPPAPPPVESAQVAEAALTTPSTHPGRFNKKRALAAIAETTTDLSSCRRAGGVWGVGQAGVVFNNDGTVRTVMMGAPFRGPEGDCVKGHIADARTDAFVGVVGPIYARFVIPY